MHATALAEGATELEEPEADDRSEPVYRFEGFHIDVSEKIVLTTVAPRSEVR